MTLGIAAKALIWIAALILALLRPTFAAPFFRALETQARRFARHRLAACLALCLLVLVARAALLPVWRIPRPTIFDEFSYILGAATFAHGRLTNPTHPLWEFFDSAYVLQHPTYASKYPPGQALFMAGGQSIFGDPWFGVWLSCGIMAAALLWALQGWMPPGWALFGGMLALPLTIDSYWMNFAAIGGALVLGGYARLIRLGQVWHALTIGLGIALLANTRPYEGLLFSIPVAIAVLLSRPQWTAFALLAVALIPASAATTYYNRAVTGHALTMPYTEYARQCAKIPLFNIQPLQPVQVHGALPLHDLLENWEPQQWSRARSWHLIPDRLNDWKFVATTILGGIMTLLPLLLFFPNLWRDRRIRLPIWCIAATLAGSWIEVCYYQHYFAPAAAALLITSVQSFRHLRVWTPGGQVIGLFFSRTIPALVLGAVLLNRGYLIRRPQHVVVNSTRPEVIGLISNLIDRHVILVRYTGPRTPHEEWVYNSAVIDDQEVIWAHDLGEVENKRLLEYYKDRKIWLFRPDIDPNRLDPYP